MTEAVRRVTIEAELPEHLAAEIEQAIADGEFKTMSDVVQGALALWSHERWPHVDPEGWREHVAEIRACVADADAHPEDDVDADIFFRGLLADLDADIAEAEAAE